MKKLYCLLVAFMPLSGLLGQMPIRVHEDSVSYGNHKHPGVVVTIPEVNYESVQKSWKKEMESGTKSRAVYENGEWSIFGANIKSVTPMPVNIYSRLVKGDSLVELRVSVELKKDVYIEPVNAGSELAKLETYLKQFSKDQYQEVADAQLKTEEKKLRELEKELSENQKNESDLNKTISSSEKTIKEQQDILNVLKTELDTLSTEMTTQNGQYASMGDSPAKEEKGKYIKDLEKRIRKLRDDSESSENRISKANTAIRDAKDEIPKSQKIQDDLKTKVAEQKAVVQKFQNKADNIKNY
jgi:DNA repair exonuclease SbcCD ATPase subunit